MQQDMVLQFHWNAEEMAKNPNVPFPTEDEIDYLLFKPDPSMEAKEYVRKVYRSFAKAMKKNSSLEQGYGNIASLKKRRDAILLNTDLIENQCSRMNLWSPVMSFTRFEFEYTVTYEEVDDMYSFTLAAALWILDNLYMTNKIFDINDFLPKKAEDIVNQWTPVDFYHPCYETDFIRSVADVISQYKKHGNYSREFRGIVSLLDARRIELAVSRFHDLQKKAIEAYMRAEEFFDREKIGLAAEYNALEQGNVLSVKTDAEKKKKAFLELEKNSEKHQELRDVFWAYFGARKDRMMGYRKLARYMEVQIDDPYEICFALVYLIARDDPSIWLEKTSCAVLNAACRMLPWYDYLDNYDDENWFSGMTYNENGWTDQKQPQEKAEFYHRFEKDGLNLAQRIYRLSKGIVPCGKHPFEKERLEMKTAEIGDADYIAGWAEMLFLSNMRIPAMNLVMEDFWDEDDEEEDEEDEEEESVTENTSNIWEEGEQSEKDGEKDELKREVASAGRRIKGLKASLSELRQTYKKEREAVEKELKELRMEHRELADLRELVFNRETELKKETDPGQEIAFPYYTKKRTVIFGGHDTFLKEIRKRLPEVKYVDVSNYGFNVDIVRNADVVWVQTNCISHSQYWRILKSARTHGIQVRYFTYASAGKCAEQLVAEDQS